MKIDWLTLTKKTGEFGRDEVENSQQAFGVARKVFDHFGIEGGSMFPVRAEGFYPWVYALEGNAATVGVSTNLLTQGVRLILSGSCHKSYGETSGWVEIARDTGWSFTRVDVACDVTGKAVDFEELEAVVKLFYPKKKRSVTHVRGVNGDTLYIGSGSSDNYARIYDKAAQQRTPRAWVRMELQIRGHTAKALGRMPGDLLTNAASHMVAWAGDIPHWFIKDVASWVHHDPERVQPIRLALSDRAVWFDNVVLKSMMTWFKTEPEQADAWVDKVSRLLDILREQE